MDNIEKIDELELLMQNSDIHAKHYIAGKHEEKDVHKNKLKADKNCSLFDFIKMVQKLTSLSLREYNIDFSSDRFKYKITDPQIELDNPIITYQTISRKPYGELKPRVRDTVYDKNADLIGNIHAQKFECVVQFNIFASVYDLAEEVMSNFENMMIKYAGYFKRNGVCELYFSEEIADSNYDLYRQVISVRNIRYKVHVENIYNNLSEIIDDVVINNVTEPVDRILSAKENKHK